MNELISKVLQWGIDKGLTGPNGTATIGTQSKKMIEEAQETRDAAVVYNLLDDKACLFDEYLVAENELKDGIGDTVVTLILLAELAGFTLEECLRHAYGVIAKRTGTTVNGTFIKD